MKINPANGLYLLQSAKGYEIKYSKDSQYSVYRDGVLIMDNIPTQRKCRNLIRNHRFNGKISLEGRE